MKLIIIATVFETASGDGYFSFQGRMYAFFQHGSKETSETFTGSRGCLIIVLNSVYPKKERQERPDAVDATFYATVGLVIFLGYMVYLKVPGLMGKALDDRAEKISSELAEARRLREEAQQLLAEYQRKRKEAEKEAAGIISSAEHEAKAIAAEAKKKTEEYIVRRTALAEQKIAQAESQAVLEVKSSAIDLAVAVTESILASKLTGKTSEDYFAKSISEVKTHLN